MMSHGKRFLNAIKQVEEEKLYTLPEAVALAKKLATAKFDETLEMHFRLGIDPRHSDQQVRSTVLLPNGLGKSVRVIVFVETGDDARKAEAAGADIIGDEQVLARIQNENWLEFDAALAVPSMMAKIGRVAKILGPRGLMPNPKAGTVVQPDGLENAIKELKAGRVEFRNDKTGNLHVPAGKTSFDVDKLTENAQAILDAVQRQRPSAVKGTFIRRLVVASTMGPGIKVEIGGGIV
ncbi:MAG: 50S ribosomal protein L1 [Anaerolineae bacterium]|nr:50S ribosomal protein L1 [Anaerolineae bacterium]